MNIVAFSSLITTH